MKLYVVLSVAGLGFVWLHSYTRDSSNVGFLFLLLVVCIILLLCIKKSTQMALETAKTQVTARNEELKAIAKVNSQLSEEITRLQAQNSSQSSLLSSYEGNRELLSHWTYSELCTTENTLHRTLEVLRQLKEQEMKRRFDNAEANFCAICNLRKLEVLFRPCRHLCCCQICAAKVTECPICRGTIQVKEKIFVQG